MTASGHVDADPAGPSPADLRHLRRCVELAAEAVAAGDFPFGSVLVAGSGGQPDPRGTGRRHRVHLG